MRTQVRSDIHQREQGYAHGQKALYEVSGVRQKELAEKGSQQGIM